MKFAITIFISFISFFGLAQRNVFVQSQQTEIKELGYGEGLSPVISTEINEDSPSGHHIISSTKLNITKKTDKIEAKIGVSFGVEYIVVCKDNKDVSLTIVWTFPNGVKGINGKEIKILKYETLKTTNEYTYSTYTIEGKNELVK